MKVYSWARSIVGATRRVAPTGAARKRLSGENAIRLLVLILVLTIVVAVFFLRDLADFSQTGYPAVAVLSLFASAGLVIPVPGIASVCAGGLLLNPLLVALIAGSAETVGELTGYTLGFSGRGMMRRGRLYMRIEEWMRRRVWLVLFLLSVIPNPIFDFAGVAAGVLRFPLWKFMAVIWPGKLIKFTVIAYACAFSMDSILRFFGIDTR